MKMRKTMLSKFESRKMMMTYHLKKKSNLESFDLKVRLLIDLQIAFSS